MQPQQANWASIFSLSTRFFGQPRETRATLNDSFFATMCDYTVDMPGTLNSFSIGNVQIDFPVVLAPLAGYTDLPYRLICRGFGAPYCTTEMMLDRQMFLDGKLRRRLVNLTDADHPVAGQLIGNEPDTMARAAKVLCEMGFDVVDLNFACPVRKALARRRGGYLMNRPEQIGQIVRAVVAASDRPVTLKLRRSFKHCDGAFWDIASSAFDAGATAITVHARSVEAKYAGPADWEFLAEVKRRFAGRTIIGSGDVLAPADALRMLEQTGVDAAVVGRGALGNPWFFNQARDLAAGRQPHVPSIAEQKSCWRSILARSANSMAQNAGRRLCGSSASNTPGCIRRPPRSAPRS